MANSDTTWLTSNRMDSMVRFSGAPSDHSWWHFIWAAERLTTRQCATVLNKQQVLNNIPCCALTFLKLPQMKNCRFAHRAKCNEIKSQPVSDIMGLLVYTQIDDAGRLRASLAAPPSVRHVSFCTSGNQIKIAGVKSCFFFTSCTHTRVTLYCTERALRSKKVGKSCDSALADSCLARAVTQKYDSFLGK